MFRRMRSLLVLLGVIAGGPAWAEDDVLLPRAAFSAVAVHQSGAFQSTETIHYADGKLRIDHGNGFSTEILDLATQTECVLMANRTYLTMPIVQALVQRFFAPDPDATNARRIGTAWVSGYAATKWAFGEDTGLNATGTAWVTKDNILIKRDYEDGLFGQTRHHLEFIDHIAIAPQPATLFRVPPGYRPAK